MESRITLRYLFAQLMGSGALYQARYSKTTKGRVEKPGILFAYVGLRWYGRQNNAPKSSP